MQNETYLALTAQNVFWSDYIFFQVINLFITEIWEFISVTYLNKKQTRMSYLESYKITIFQ